jgi:hypothetical protein
MNFSELKSETSELLNFNTGQTDQDFTASQIAKAVNRAYRREYVRARQEGVRRFFLATTDMVWPASTATVPLPGRLVGAQLLRVMDITGGLPGSEVIFSDDSTTGDMSWADRNSLQMGTTGPGAEKTFRFTFFPSAEKLINDDDVPGLISEEHHELIFYSAAIDMRNRADEIAPQSWMYERESLRQDYWKDVSRNRPHDDVVGVMRTTPSQGHIY